MAYYVYIMTNWHNTVLYTGVTNNLARRVSEHQQSSGKSFTARYHVNKLVYCEAFHEASYAIQAEKQIKSWSRAKKIQLIEKNNPEWKDLFAEDLSAL